MTLNLKWAWDLTPSQLFQKNRFVKITGAAKLFQATRPFSSAKTPLPGTPFSYQLALTDKGRSEESQALRQAHPDIEASGDFRSGVLIFDGDTIVASLLLSGASNPHPFKMVVNESYRGQGLAERLLVEWWSKVKHTHRETGGQPMTLVSVKVLLKAHKALVESKADAPKRVKDAVKSGEEASTVLKAAEEVEGI